MLETVLAVIFVTFAFLVLFQFSHWLTARILTEHAAARAARARAVGLNDFMCRKSARVAVIPAAGRLLWPGEDDLAEGEELWRVSDYLCSENWGRANGILDYERWHTMDFDLKTGFGNGSTCSADVGLRMPRFIGGGDDACESGVRIGGSAEVESHFPLYMNNQGL